MADPAVTPELLKEQLARTKMLLEQNAVRIAQVQALIDRNAVRIAQTQAELDGVSRGHPPVLSDRLALHSFLTRRLNVRCALADPLTDLFDLARALVGYVSNSISGPASQRSRRSCASIPCVVCSRAVQAADMPGCWVGRLGSGVERPGGCDPVLMPGH